LKRGQIRLDNRNHKNKNRRGPCHVGLINDLSENISEHQISFDVTKSQRLDIVMIARRLIEVPCWFAKLFADNIHIARGFDSNPNGIRTDADNRHRHVITNQDLFAWLSREHQHTATPFMVL
jgi:hypothetical protein